MGRGNLRVNLTGSSIQTNWITSHCSEFNEMPCSLHGPLIVLCSNVSSTSFLTVGSCIPRGALTVNIGRVSPTGSSIQTTWITSHCSEFNEMQCSLHGPLIILSSSVGSTSFLTVGSCIPSGALTESIGRVSSTGSSIHTEGTTGHDHCSYKTCMCTTWLESTDLAGNAQYDCLLPCC